MCLNCGAETANPRFCSRSCAAKFNNARPDVKRRLPEGSCATCGAPIKACLKYCPQHKMSRPGKVSWSDKFLDKTVNSNAGSNADVRQIARRAYKLSGRPMKCALCGYDIHVDICHLKDIRAYLHGTSYAVINDQANLLALCRNHHWELDHDLLLATGRT